METFYRAYTKTINGTLFYFAKSWHAFPEYRDLAPVPVGFGMNTSFKRACRIAGIDDPAIRQQLLQQIEDNAEACKVIPLSPQVNNVYKLKRKHGYFPSLLKLIGIS